MAKDTTIVTMEGESINQSISFILGSEAHKKRKKTYKTQ